MNIIDFAFQQFLSQQESLRLQIHKNFVSVYEFDKFEVQRIIYETFLNKPFSKATLDKMVFYFENVIDKPLNRKVAGLFSNDIVINVKKGNKVYNVSSLLERTNFRQILFDVFKISKFINTAMLYINIVNGQYIFERITGAECIVEKGEHYLIPKSISMFRSDENNNAFVLYWSNEKAVKVYGTKEIPLFDTPENPFGIMPFVILRDKIGNDFWGEPNWSLYYYQLFHIIRQSDNQMGEFYQKFPILFGENVDAEKIKVTPHELISVVHTNPDVKVSLDYISPNVDWSNIRENVKADYERMIINQNIPPESVSVRAIQQSGYAKTIDEIEFREIQEFDIAKLYDFILDFTNKFLIINDYFKIYDLPSDGEVEVIINPRRIIESPQDIKARREMEKEYLIKDEIDFIMEDLGLGYEEAVQYLKERLKRKEIIDKIREQLTSETSQQGILDLLDALIQNKVSE